MKKIISILLLLVCVSTFAMCKVSDEELNKIIVTTTDLKQEYEIIDICFEDCIYDFLREGVTGAIKKLKKQAHELGADAIVGIKICYLGSASSNDFIIMGTAVKLKK